MTTTKQSARGNVSQFTRWTADSGRIGSLSMATKTSSPPIRSSQFDRLLRVRRNALMGGRRPFSWFSRNRGVAKDYENLADTIATFVTLAAIELSIRPLAMTGVLHQELIFLHMSRPRTRRRYAITGQFAPSADAFPPHRLRQFRPLINLTPAGRTVSAGSVEPEPAKQSMTMSPRFVTSRSASSSRTRGLTVGWKLRPSRESDPRVEPPG